MTVSKTLLLLLALAAVLMMQHYYPQMPDPMASHFDGAGRPNGYQSRDGFFLLSGVMLLFVVAIFGGMGFIFRVVPTNLFNLPHREYWLAPERKASTLEFMSRQMEWFGVVTLILLLGVLWFAMKANLLPHPVLDSRAMWWMMGAYLAYTVVWLVRFLLRFRRVEA